MLLELALGLAAAAAEVRGRRARQCIRRARAAAAGRRRRAARSSPRRRLPCALLHEEAVLLQVGLDVLARRRALALAVHELRDRLRLRVVDPQRVHRRLEPVVQLGRPDEPLLLVRPPRAPAAVAVAADADGAVKGRAAAGLEAVVAAEAEAEAVVERHRALRRHPRHREPGGRPQRMGERSAVAAGAAGAAGHAGAGAAAPAERGGGVVAEGRRQHARQLGERGVEARRARLRAS